MWWSYMTLMWAGSTWKCDMHLEATSLKILNNVSTTLSIMDWSLSRRQSACNTGIFKSSQWNNVCVRVRLCGCFNLCSHWDFLAQQWCIVLHFLKQQSIMTFPASVSFGTFTVNPYFKSWNHAASVWLEHTKQSDCGIIKCSSNNLHPKIL